MTARYLAPWSEQPAAAPAPRDCTCNAPGCLVCTVEGLRGPAQTPRAIVLGLERFAGLVLVPVAVRALMAAGDTLEQAWAALEALDEAGVIELRPDAGDTLTEEDRALCPRQPPPGRGYLVTLRICEEAS